MSRYSKLFRALVALAVTAGLGILIGLLVSKQGDIKPVVTTAPGSNPDGSTASSGSVVPPAPHSNSPFPPGTKIIRDKSLDHVLNQPGAKIADWEQRLDDILLGDDDENGKADKLLALIPRAPTDAQQELAQHLVNMVQDEHYDGTAQLLTNSATPADVSDVLMNDLLNRNNNLKLPMLLAIARNDTHPLKDQALDLLGLLTQEDKGTNWDDWSSTVDKWLQDNPQ